MTQRGRRFYFYLVAALALPVTLIPAFIIYLQIKEGPGGATAATFALLLGFLPAYIYRTKTANRKLADARIDLLWIWVAIIGGVSAYNDISFEKLGIGKQDSIAIFLVAAGIRAAKSHASVEEAQLEAGGESLGSLQPPQR